eukprot:Amastigsp_a174667_196.p4 type:complete len:132 gc:universal Amastigsp_a174667_196:1516-1911(+)
MSTGGADASADFDFFFFFFFFCSLASPFALSAGSSASLPDRSLVSLPASTRSPPISAISATRSWNSAAFAFFFFFFALSSDSSAAEIETSETSLALSLALALALSLPFAMSSGLRSLCFLLLRPSSIASQL